jgi:hypothetical protein
VKQGARAAAAGRALIETATLNNVDPQVRLAEVLARIAEQKTSRIDEILPWRYY